MASSLHNIIFNNFRLVLVLWSLLLQVVHSLYYVIVVQKSSSGDRKFTLYGWGYYFPRTLLANLHYWGRSHFESILHQVSH